jgi:hypothetical protein
LHDFIIFHRLDKLHYHLVNTRMHPRLIKFFFHGNDRNPLKGNRCSRQLAFLHNSGNSIGGVDQQLIVEHEPAPVQPGWLPKRLYPGHTGRDSYVTLIFMK